MIIENEFSVGADVETVWRQLLDMEGVASCLPGATIKATDQENVYDGSMRLKIGPMRVEYRGTAELSEIDEQNRTAVISLSAREAKGQGSALATIRNRVEPTDSGTSVRAETDLHITGPQAQFGRGVIEDVGKRVLSEFSQRLEQRIAGPGSGSAPSGSGAVNGAAGPSAPDVPSPEHGTSPPAAAPPPPPQPIANELDVGALISRTPAARAGVIGLGLVAILLVLLRRRR